MSNEACCKGWDDLPPLTVLAQRAARHGASDRAAPGISRTNTPLPFASLLKPPKGDWASAPATDASAVAKGDALPVTGAWREDEARGPRMYAELGPLPLEGGGKLPAVRLAYETWGKLNPARNNAILILHALTGDSHVAGPAGPGQPTPGWWAQAVGPKLPLDTDKYFIVAPNVLGGCMGSTGPSSLAPDGREWGSRFPQLSTRDMVRAEARLADLLGIDQFAAIVGPSAGGHRAVEWAVTYPERTRTLILVATAACTTAEQAAWAHAQIAAIELDPHFNGGDYYHSDEGPVRGLGLAREIAHTTYRTPLELDERFGRNRQGDEEPLAGGRLAVQSYLDYHARKLAARFDAGSYRILSKAMITHDVGRGRGGVAEALARFSGPALVVGVNSDRLFYARDCEKMAKALPGGRFAQIHTPFGHDGFLIEFAQVNAILAEFMEELE
ncbi:homoserine O-acetyltransferase [Winkia neuii BV029A5]|mgnify:CR=1 FL=1|uniref:Homoserine O-acetyltransferase n=1 Tax=Winkia neuii BV029A5 TaxID=888439 RepID=K0YQX6_9ACTO|nr:homoserine O-acetyltransferase [Winkia neuii BV029A5]